MTLQLLIPVNPYGFAPERGLDHDCSWATSKPGLAGVMDTSESLRRATREGAGVKALALKFFSTTPVNPLNITLPV